MVTKTKRTSVTRGRKGKVVRVKVSRVTRATRPPKVTPLVAKPVAQKPEISPRDWTRYQRDHRHEDRQKLLNAYLPLVRNVAARMAMGFPRSVELTDLVNTGVIGLIEAFGNFDPRRGVKFETYAVPRIRGAILDELRALDWVPRSTRARSREIDRATNHLENELGRAPEIHELARKLKLSEQEMHHAIDDVSSTSILSLDEVIYPEDENRQVPRIETVHNDTAMSILGEIERGELRSFLVVAMDRLTNQEKLVIALYYFEELTLKEIGEVMSISESRVSQIHTRAVSKLRHLVREKFAMTA